MIRLKKKNRECWVLNYESIKWLKEHFEIYREDASRIVKLDYHKFKYKNKEYTQIEIINKIIILCTELLRIMEENNYSKSGTRAEKIKNEIFDLYKLVFWVMWW